METLAKSPKKNYWTALADGYAKFPAWILPIFIFIAPLCYWIGFDDIKQNYILDKYSVETSGEITRKYRDQRRRWGHNHKVDFKYLPENNYAYAGTTGFLDTVTLVKRDPTKPARHHVNTQTIPKTKWMAINIGDSAKVEYTVYKGQLFSRVHNPILPWMGLLLIFFGTISALASAFSVWGKVRRAPRASSKGDICAGS